MSSLLGLDIGAKRIGVALTRDDVRIAQPLTTLTVADESGAVQQIVDLVTQHNVGCIVVGWPRGLDGQTTAQTKAVEALVAELRQESQLANIPVVLQDEALTSQKAEAELEARRKPYAKGDIDALAATFILEDYLRDQPAEVHHV